MIRYAELKLYYSFVFDRHLWFPLIFHDSRFTISKQNIETIACFGQQLFKKLLNIKNRQPPVQKREKTEQNDYGYTDTMQHDYGN